MCAGTHEGVRPVMNVFLRLFMLTAVLAIAGSIPAAASEFPQFPFLLVEGKAKVDVRPDKATLRIYLSAFDKESVAAVETLQEQLIVLLETLAKHEIPEDAITSYNLVKEVERARKDRVEMEIVGYYVSRRLKVELTDISRFAVLVADIARLDNVSSLDANFDVADRSSIELTLMNEAGADARRIAENMVHGMSRAVGSVHAISKSSIQSSIAAFAFGAGAVYPAAMMGISNDYQQTIFQPSTIVLRQSIHVMFELE